MNGIYELLNHKDRRILGGLFLLLILSLLGLFIVALGAKRSYFESLNLLASQKENASKVAKTVQDENGEWLKWQKTLDDIKEVRAKYFYNKEEGISRLMRDTQQILNRARMRVSQKRYDYAELEEGTYRTVRVTFETTGSYTDLKRFIHSIEVFPRFLVVQRIDFLDVDPLSGGLKVKVALVAYYEQ